MPPDPVWGRNHFNPGWKNKDHPIVMVTWEDAQAYCKWAGTRLPTEAQWEKAARGREGKRYSWGNKEPTKANAGNLLWSSINSTKDRTHPVGKFPSSEYGLYDMEGNVWKWGEDELDKKVGGSQEGEC